MMPKRAYEVALVTGGPGSVAVSYQFPESLVDVELDAVHLNYTADANVGNRDPSVRLTSRTGRVICEAGTQTPVTVSQIRLQTFVPKGTAFFGATFEQMGFVERAEPFDILSVQTVGGLAGDVVTATLRYRARHLLDFL